MVRTYERTPGSRNYKNYTDENLQNAVEAVRAGMSQKLASKTFKVPRATLQRKLLGRNLNPVGHPRVLSDEEETTITDSLGIVANWGFPLTRYDVRMLIGKYIEKQGKTVRLFKNNIPGDDFLNSFITRNNLSIRLASNIKRSRASVDKDDIMTFFNNIQEALAEVDDYNIYNYDETNITDDPGSKKVVVPRSTKRVERVQSHSRTAISIMVCGNARGDLLPPMVVYKASNMYENWTEGGPSGTKYANSPSGWFDMNLFEMWYFKILLPHINSTRTPGSTTIVVGDNLASHFSPKVIQSCRENHIYMTPFPANATHLMQPLDVAVFRPMKAKWRQILDTWRKESRYPGNLPKEQFPVLLSKLWKAVSSNIGQNLISGFRATGLYPSDPTQVLKRIPDGLTEDTEAIGRSLDSSLIDLLREHRGIGFKSPKRKRGKKIQPGKNLAAETSAPEPGNSRTPEPRDSPTFVPRDSPTPLNEDSGDIDKPVSMSEVASTSELSLSALKKGKHPKKKFVLPVEKRTRQKRNKDNSKCGICRITWKDWKSPIDWIMCTKCRQWICGFCNHDSKDPYFMCERCEDSESDQYEMFDDSDADKDFDPDDV